MTRGDWFTAASLTIAFLALVFNAYTVHRMVRRDQTTEEAAAVAALRTELRDARTEIQQLRAEVRDTREDLEQAQRDRRALQGELTRVLREINRD